LSNLHWYSMFDRHNMVSMTSKDVQMLLIFVFKLIQEFARPI
jgi:hypothetical protein